MKEFDPQGHKKVKKADIRPNVSRLDFRIFRGLTILTPLYVQWSNFAIVPKSPLYPISFKTSYNWRPWRILETSDAEPQGRGGRRGLPLENGRAH